MTKTTKFLLPILGVFVFALPSVASATLILDVNTASDIYNFGPSNTGIYTATTSTTVLNDGYGYSSLMYGAVYHADIVAVAVLDSPTSDVISGQKCIVFNALSPGIGGTAEEQYAMSQFGGPGDLDPSIYDVTYDNPSNSNPPCSTVLFNEGETETIAFYFATYSSGTIDVLASTNLMKDTFVQMSSDGTFPEPIQPTETTFNEVLNYLPSGSFSTTTGTTTVGASFSIAQTDFVSAIGYRLYSSDGSVLAEEFQNVSSNGVYDVSFDYNFSTVGEYQARAYFVNDQGETPNLSGQFIYVGLVDGIGPIAIGTDGRFYFTGGPGATTSTTTIGNANFNCSQFGWADSICNVAVGLFVPLPTTVSGISTSYQNLLTKSPFNFFYDSYNFLRSVGGAFSAPDSTLTLTFYDEPVTIVSTTTLASVGASSTTVDDLKDVISVGLWLLFLVWLFKSSYKFISEFLNPVKS